MSDYERAAEALRYLSEHFEEQPSLNKVAAAIHLSPYHFQRIFKRSVGLSPKRFLQLLTIEHAKQLLSESRSVLEASLESGLSGPGRLHDLFVTFEAVTPGEFKAGGSGVEMLWEVAQSPFGDVFVAGTERGLTAVRFLADVPASVQQEGLQKRWPGAVVRQGGVPHARKLEAIFEYREPTRPIPLITQGTNFQIQVWKALLQVPLGSVWTYTDLADRVCSPRAVRAVANAVGANPIHFLIPCHRVIRKMGMLGGYAGGLSRKRTLLAWEVARQQAGKETVA